MGELIRNKVELESAEIQSTHIYNAVILTELLVNFSDYDSAVFVKELLHLFDFKDCICGICTKYKVNSTQSAL